MFQYDSHGTSTVLWNSAVGIVQGMGSNMEVRLQESVAVNTDLEDQS